MAPNDCFKKRKPKIFGFKTVMENQKKVSLSIRNTYVKLHLKFSENNTVALVLVFGKTQQVPLGWPSRDLKLLWIS